MGVNVFLSRIINYAYQAIFICILSEGEFSFSSENLVFIFSINEFLNSCVILSSKHWNIFNSKLSFLSSALNNKGDELSTFFLKLSFLCDLSHQCLLIISDS